MRLPSLHARSRPALLACAFLALLALAGSEPVRADPPADASAPPNFLDYPAFVGVPVADAPVSVLVPPTVGAGVTTACQWQDGGTGSVPDAWADVSGATRCSGWVVPSNLKRHWLRPRVSASNAAGSSIAPAPELRVSGDVVYASAEFSTAVPKRNVITVMNVDGVGARALTPATVRFTQDSVRSTFRNGASIDDLAVGLRTGRIGATSIPPIRVFRRAGQLFTLDNRLLEAFRRAGIGVPYRMATSEEIAAEAYKFTTRNGGTSVRIRGS